MNNHNDSEILAETDNFAIWRSYEEEVGNIYHLEIGNVTVHLMPDDWEELITLVRDAS